MALLSVQEIGRRSSDAINAQGVLVRDHWITYRVYTNGVQNDGESVCNLFNNQFPFGSFYRSPENVVNLGMRLMGREPNNNPEFPEEWTIEDHYSSQWFGGAGPGTPPEPNPLLRPPVYRRSRQEVQQAFEVDLYGDALANSADEPYDPPVTREGARRIITVTLNVPSPFDEKTFDSYYDNHVNSVTWKGYPPYTVKISGADSQQVTEGQFIYDQVTITLKVQFGARIVRFEGLSGAGGILAPGGALAAGGFKEVWRIIQGDELDDEPEGAEWQGWDKLVVDQGFYRLNTLTRGHPDRSPIVNGLGVQITRPVLLTGYGRHLTSDEDATNFAIPRYHRYWTYNTLDITAKLGI